MRTAASIPGFVLLLGAISPADAYVRATPSGQPLVRSSSVTFVLQPSVSAGVRNASGQTVITPESDPAAAISAAMSAWNTVPGAALNLSSSTASASRPPGLDSTNIITFEDTTTTRDIVGSAIAVTAYYYRPSQAVIVDSDIVFNPDMTFSTIPTLDAIDLQSILTHELGHAIGLDHTPLTSAVMYPYSMPEDVSSRSLSNDERAFARDAYPRDNSYGGIRGSITMPSGQFPESALVLVLNTETGMSVAPYCEGNSYSTGGLPAGNYVVIAYPIVSIDSEDYEAPDWQSAFYGGATPQVVSVPRGSYAQADISIPNGPGQFAIDYALFDSPATFYSSNLLPSGSSVPVTLIGRGFTTDIKPENISAYGFDATVQTDSLEITPPMDESGIGLLSFVLNVPERPDWTEGAIVIRSNGLSAVTADMRIAPAQPAFAPSGLVNAADFDTGPLAPGEIFSIFGTKIGPEDPVSATLNPQGALPTQLGNTTVEMQGQGIPLLYVSSSQINAQVPFEVAGQPSVKVRLRRGTHTVDAILPVATASPAIFGVWDQPAILNQNGSQNCDVHPAERGSVVVIYGTGQGVVDPAIATGVIAPGDTLSCAHNVTATIDGKPARVDFAGMAPGFVGLWQVNVVVPKEMSVGPVPLVLTVNESFESMAAYLFVR